MYSYQKHIATIIPIILCCFLFTSCSTKTQPSNTTRESQTLPQITKSSENNSSFSEQLSEVRKQTELLDDRTEKMLNRNKKWIGLGIIVFLWLAFQSLINYGKD